MRFLSPSSLSLACKVSFSFKNKSSRKIHEAKAELKSMRKGMFDVNSKHVTSS